MPEATYLLTYLLIFGLSSCTDQDVIPDSLMSIQEGGSSPNTFITNTDCADLSFNEHGIAIDNGMFVFETFEDMDQTLSIINNMNIEDYVDWLSPYGLNTIYSDYESVLESSLQFFENIEENYPDLSQAEFDLMYDDWVLSNSNLAIILDDEILANINNAMLEGILDREGQYRICNTIQMITENNSFSFPINDSEILEYVNQRRNSVVKPGLYFNDKLYVTSSNGYSHMNTDAHKYVAYDNVCVNNCGLFDNGDKKIVGKYHQIAWSGNNLIETQPVDEQFFRWSQVVKNQPKKRDFFRHNKWNRDKRHVAIQYTSRGKNIFLKGPPENYVSIEFPYYEPYIKVCEYTKELKREFGDEEYEPGVWQGDPGRTVFQVLKVERTWIQYTNRQGDCSTNNAICQREVINKEISDWPIDPIIPWSAIPNLCD